MLHTALHKRMLPLIFGSVLLFLALPATAATTQVKISAVPSKKAANHEATKKAVEDLFKSIDYANTYEKTLSRLIEVQIQQQPELEPYKEIFSDFFDKYLSWKMIKDEIIALYSKTYTIEEIKALTAFYNTPVGKKSLKSMPELTAQSAAIGQQRIKKHEKELLDLISEAQASREKE